MWEYQLNLTPFQIDRLIMHAWEMGNAYFDYFFFKENCSYHILSLLEYANPKLHLRDHFYFWTIPADTVRVVMAKQGLVGVTTYRPSRSTLIKRKRNFLTPQSESSRNSSRLIPPSHTRLLLRDCLSSDRPWFWMLRQTISATRARVTIRR